MLRRGLRWLLKVVLSLLQRFLLWIMASGPIPNHVAFVMDGNRRYARRNGMPITAGHYAGYSSLYRVSIHLSFRLYHLLNTPWSHLQMLEICFRLPVRVVTVYAFAIDNFKRPPAEVDALMALCKDKLTELCEHRSELSSDF